jgi:hypothetical protein
VGLLKVQGTTKHYPTVRKTLKLIVEEVNEQVNFITGFICEVYANDMPLRFFFRERYTVKKRKFKRKPLHHLHVNYLIYSTAFDDQFVGCGFCCLFLLNMVFL